MDGGAWYAVQWDHFRGQTGRATSLTFYFDALRAKQQTHSIVLGLRIRTGQFGSLNIGIFSLGHHRKYSKQSRGRRFKYKVYCRLKIFIWPYCASASAHTSFQSLHL